MAAAVELPAPSILRRDEPPSSAVSSYVGLSFAVFLGLLPKAAAAHLCALQSHNRRLAHQLRHAEDQIHQMRSRRKEDSKANARVVEIFATHRNAWQQEERRLLARIEELRARVEQLETSERDLTDRLEEKKRDEAAIDAEAEREREALDGSCSNVPQNLQFQAYIEPSYCVNHFVPRRDSPWKGGCEATGIPVKLKQVDQDLDDLDKFGNLELSTIRKQAKRYQSLTSKIDDLCKRMQAGDHSNELTIRPEFRTQTQTEFLLEACRLQQRATETRQRLIALQAEMVTLAKLDTRKYLDSVRVNFREIQRNLEVWLARIVGDIEGILAREGVSRVKDYYFSRYPFVR